jgi:hypothetical protein
MQGRHSPHVRPVSPASSSRTRPSRSPAELHEAFEIVDRGIAMVDEAIGR